MTRDDRGLPDEVLERIADAEGRDLVGDPRKMRMRSAPNKFGDVRVINGVDAAAPGKAEFVRFTLAHPMPILITWQANRKSDNFDVTPNLILRVRSSIRDAFVAEDVIGGQALTPPQIIIAQAQVITAAIPLLGEFVVWVVATPMTSL
jgi:hypothetical protein